jgi:hypothetical protein
VSLESAIEIGALLHEAKAATGHGAFGKWLVENVQFSDRTARRYMTIFDNRERLLKSDTVSNLQSAYRPLSPHVSPDRDSWGTAISEAESEFVAFEATLNDPTATVADMFALMRRAQELAKELTSYLLDGERAMGELLITLTPEPGRGYVVECELHGQNGKNLLLVEPALPEGHYWVNLIQMGPGENEACTLEAGRHPVRRDDVSRAAFSLLHEADRYSSMLWRDCGILVPTCKNPLEGSIAGTPSPPTVTTAVLGGLP